MVAGDNADLLAVDVKNRIDLAGLVELEQVAITASRDDSFARGDATRRNLDQIDDVLRMADSDDSPLHSCFSRIPSPKNLCGSLRLRFKNEAWR